MSLQVTRLEDADVEEIVRLQFLAFSSTGRINAYFGNDEKLPENEFRELCAKKRASMKSNPHSNSLVVTDTAIGKIIAYAHWNINAEGYTQEEIDNFATHDPAPERANAQAWNDFFGHLAKARTTVLGSAPAAFLQVLVAHPEHHRRGAGTLLVTWGVDKADELGIRSYLESSLEGRRLYERFGFREVYTKTFPLSKYGGSAEEVDSNCVMLREARGDTTS